jgi:4-aminobutyrate aminotransferase-like enzyme
VIEDAGRFGQVVKMIPPLVIPEEQLLEGLNILKSAMQKIMGASLSTGTPPVPGAQA